MYKIEFKKGFDKDLLSLPKQYQEKARKLLLGLKNDPFPVGCKKLKGKEDNIYRLRVGPYRIIYQVEKGVLLVLVLSIGKRDKIYKDLK